MFNLNCYPADDRRFNAFFGWLRWMPQCAYNKWLPTFRGLQSIVKLQSYSDLQSQNWIKSKKIVKPNLFKQKWWHLNPSIYWNVARFKSKSKYMFISDHFHVLGMRMTRSMFLALRPTSLRGKYANLHTVAASKNRDHPTRSLYYYCLFTSHLFVCCSLPTSRSWWITLSMQRQVRDSKNFLSFLQWTAPIARSFCEVGTWHHLHILFTAPLCCEWKGWVASAQSFTLWQQATIETHVMLILSPLVHATYIWVLFFKHIPFLVNRTFNTERLQHL